MMLTCSAEIDNLNCYASPRIGLLCSNDPFPSMIRGRYGKRLVKRKQRWEWRKGGGGIPDRWRLSAIIAYGVIMHLGRVVEMVLSSS